MTLPTIELAVAFAASASQSDYLVFDDRQRGVLDLGEFGPDDGFWTTLTQTRAVSFSRGSTRSEGVYMRAEAGSLSALLDNRNGDFDPTNLSGPYVSAGETLVVPMRPVRVRAAVGTTITHLGCDGTTTAYATTPDAARFTLSGTFALAARVAPNDWDADNAIVAKWEGAGQRSWQLYLSGGVPQVAWSDNGTTIYTNTFLSWPTPSPGEPMWLYAIVVASSGYVWWLYSGSDTNNFWAVDDWTLAEINAVTATGGPFDSSAAVRIGARTGATALGFNGKIYAVLIRDLNATTIAADPVFAQGMTTSLTDTAATDSRGNVWTLNGTAAWGEEPRAFDLFRGFVDSWDLLYPAQAHDAVARLRASDAVKIVSNFDGNEQAAAGAGEDSGARIGRILNNVGWPATDRNIAAGDTTLQATTLAANAWTEMQLVADTEIGELYVSRDGKFVFRNRQAVIGAGATSTPVAIFGDAADGHVPYHDVRITYDDQLIRNKISIARAGGTAQTADDVTSQTDYMVRTFNRTDLLMETDAVAADYADYVLFLLKDPELRIDELTLRPERNPDDWPSVLSREIGDLIEVNFTPTGAASAISRKCIIRGIDHDISPNNDWTVRFALQDVTPFAQFMVLDHTDRGLLDTGRLAF